MVRSSSVSASPPLSDSSLLRDSSVGERDISSADGKFVEVSREMTFAVSPVSSLRLFARLEEMVTLFVVVDLFDI